MPMEIGPVVAPAGTSTVMVVVVLAVTTAETPLKSTRLSVNVVLKFVPVIVINAPSIAEAGEKEEMVGIGPQSTIKSLVLVAL